MNNIRCLVALGRVAFLFPNPTTPLCPLSLLITTIVETVITLLHIMLKVFHNEWPEKINYFKKLVDRLTSKLLGPLSQAEEEQHEKIGKLLCDHRLPINFGRWISESAQLALCLHTHHPWSSPVACVDKQSVLPDVMQYYPLAMCQKSWPHILNLHTIFFGKEPLRGTNDVVPLHGQEWIFEVHHQLWILGDVCGEFLSKISKHFCVEVTAGGGKELRGKRPPLQVYILKALWEKEKTDKVTDSVTESCDVGSRFNTNVGIRNSMYLTFPPTSPGSLSQSDPSLCWAWVQGFWRDFFCQICAKMWVWGAKCILP